jgi:hypothetical protein
LAEFEETTQFSYRVIQNLFLRSGPDKSSWNMLTNYAPKDYIPEGKIFTWKRRPDAGNCTAGRGGEIWCQLTYTPDNNKWMGQCTLFAFYDNPKIVGMPFPKPLY